MLLSSKQNYGRGSGHAARKSVHLFVRVMMKVLEDPSLEMWEGVASHCEGATFYHSPLWSKALVETYPHYVSSPKGFLFDDGSKALLPLLSFNKRSFLKKKIRYKSMGFGSYGGLVSTGSWSEEKNEQIYNWLKASGASIYIDGNPFSTYDLPACFVREQRSTYALRLDTSIEGIWKGFSSGHRKSIKKASRMGVTVRKATSYDDYRTYLAVYEDTLTRWGEKTIITFPHDLLLQLLEPQYDTVTLWLAILEDKVIAGVIMFYWNAICCGWHGCSLTDFSSYHPNNLLHWYMIQDALERHYQFYDFGPSGEEQKGVADFKRHFGAEQFLFTSGYVRQ